MIQVLSHISDPRNRANNINLQLNILGFMSMPRHGKDLDAQVLCRVVGKRGRANVVIEKSPVTLALAPTRGQERCPGGSRTPQLCVSTNRWADGSGWAPSGSTRARENDGPVRGTAAVAA